MEVNDSVIKAVAKNARLSEEDAVKFISWGVDGIYSNSPEMIRMIVG